VEDTGARKTGNPEVEPPNAGGPEVPLWEVISALGVDSGGTTGNSEVIHMFDRRSRKLINHRESSSIPRRKISLFIPHHFVYVSSNTCVGSILWRLGGTLD